MRGVAMMLHQVNKIREVPGHADVVVTHTDSKDLYVWHTERQPNNRKEKVAPFWCPDVWYPPALTQTRKQALLGALRHHILLLRTEFSNGY